MSRLRPELHDTSKPVTVTNGTAYYAILGAVDGQHGLCHGKLNDRGMYCAIGSYFSIHPRDVLPTSLIDEVAAVNDSVPHTTPKQRKRFVERWLRWKLTQLGLPGFRTRQPPTAGSR